MFLVRHTKALLLVDNQQPKVLEAHILLQQSVSSDHDIDLTFTHTFQDGSGLGGRAKSGKHLDLDRKCRQSALEGAVVLLREDGGWNEDSDLLSIHNSLKGRS